MRSFHLLLLCSLISLPAVAQESGKINHLTVEEDNLVRDTQELDKRLEIFVKAVDRRILVLNGAAEVKEKKKEAEKWGALPTGDRAELLGDIKSILNEAVTKIDDAAERNAKSPLLPKALKTLVDGCSRFVPQLKTIQDNAKSEAESSAAYDSIETCKEVIESQSKINPNMAK
jgi:hypothetical protein